MPLFLPGDKIVRTNQNYWWLSRCRELKLDPKDVFTVTHCNDDYMSCAEWDFKVTPENFKLVEKIDPKKIIEARIKKLYGKCKTTAHWS